MKYRLLLAALLATSLLSAKSYRFTLRQAASLSGTQLEPGEYKLDVNDNTVKVHSKSGQEIPAKAKVEATNDKAVYTSVTVQDNNGTKRISAIRLAGSKDQVVFD